MVSTTTSRIGQLQLREPSRLVVSAAHKSEDLSRSAKGVALTCPFVIIVFANVNYHYIFLLLSYLQKEERMHEKHVLRQTTRLSKQTNKITDVCFMKFQ